jgi:hypothetical protein
MSEKRCVLMNFENWGCGSALAVVFFVTNWHEFCWQIEYFLTG